MPRMSSESVQHEVWESLGESDPDWAVLTDQRRRNRGWENDLDAFYATGSAEIRDVLAALPAGVGRGVAVDWGSGTGRLTFALAEHF
ncbi:MAG TPA: SAM-dependent methyltransferase, partial [Actinomycetes bacterium]|nr:SAM-dependent methyltransferase [Actinomycetes bacterium]